MRRASPLIVGGGPAGAAAAITLARAGFAPLVLERSATAQDPLCGGFLSWNTAARLAALGVDVAAIGARPLRCVALFAGSRHAAARLPHTSFAVSRRALDAALLDQAARCGATIARGVHVTAVEARRARLADGNTLDTDAVILATGKHDLRGSGRAAGGDDPAVGLRWRLPASPALLALVGDAVELHLFAGGYAGLEIQEDGSANLCMAVRRRLLAAAHGDPASLLDALAAANPHLAARLDAAGGPPGKAQAVANVPYGWRAAAMPDAPYRVGDQAAVIPSLAGEGIAIALASGVAAGTAVARGVPAPVFQRAQHRAAARPLCVAGATWRAAESAAGARLLIGVAQRLPWSVAAIARLSRI